MPMNTGCSLRDSVCIAYPVNGCAAHRMKARAELERHGIDPDTLDGEPLEILQLSHAHHLLVDSILQHPARPSHSHLSGATHASLRQRSMHCLRCWLDKLDKMETSEIENSLVMTG
jgi:hypothetical protein